MTRGSDPDDFRLPDEKACKRAAKIADLLLEDRDMPLCIIGGYPDVEGVTLAERMEAYFKQEHPSLANRILIVNGDSNNTVDDLVNLSKEIDRRKKDENIVLVLASRPTHCYRVYSTIFWLDYDCEMHSSREQVRFKDLAIDLIGSVVNCIDPFHKWFLGKKLREMANQNAAAHLEWTAHC